MISTSRLVFSRRVPALVAATFFLTVSVGLSAGQSSSSSSSSSGGSGGTVKQDSRSRPAPRIAQPEAGGSAITLETSEPLFDLAVGLNACGYDAGLAESSPVRLKIRQEVNDALSSSAEARASRDALCTYIREHALADSGRNLAQYVSLALYLTPPPQLAPTVDETELPPDSTQVVNILPLLRTFGTETALHAIWVRHIPDYEALVAQVHDPLTKMILNTNIYLRMPVSSYDGRRFLVLLEPMLSPGETNARIYSNDYIVVTSPAAPPAPLVHMEEIRHTYLHYEVEPLVYARASAMDRLLPLLKPVQDAPLEFTYKSDIVALLTECLIKAVEVRTMDVGLPKPVRPDEVKQRSDMAKYDADLAAYDREAEQVRQKRVTLEMRQGWILVNYFYDQLGAMEKDSISLKEDIGEMVYGMDVDREKHHDEQIEFLPVGSQELVRRAPRRLVGMDLAEMKLMKGDVSGAEDMADAALKANPEDARANYLAGRVELMKGEPDDALAHLTKTLTLAKDPRTLAWTHIYLGRLYDIERDPNDPGASGAGRAKAIAQYKAALAVRDGQPDTKAAADKGIQEPFALPKRERSAQDEDDAPLDPSGKAEKDAYRPPPPGSQPQ